MHRRGERRDRVRRPDVASAIDHGKHVVLLNAELDWTLGPILNAGPRCRGRVHRCRRRPAGCDHEPRPRGRDDGLHPSGLGNIKSLLDHRRTPETQEGFAENVFQRPKHITNFADGTKIAAEMVCIANATGFGVSQRGMAGPEASGSRRPLACSRLRSCSRRARASSTTSSAPSRAWVCSCSPTATTGSTSVTWDLQDGRRPHLQLLPAVPP